MMSAIFMERCFTTLTLQGPVGRVKEPEKPRPTGVALRLWGWAAVPSGTVLRYHQFRVGVKLKIVPNLNPH